MELSEIIISNQPTNLFHHFWSGGGIGLPRNLLHFQWLKMIQSFWKTIEVNRLSHGSAIQPYFYNLKVWTFWPIRIWPGEHLPSVLRARNATWNPGFQSRIFPILTWSSSPIIIMIISTVWPWKKSIKTERSASKNFCSTQSKGMVWGLRDPQCGWNGLVGRAAISGVEDPCSTSPALEWKKALGP